MRYSSKFFLQRVALVCGALHFGSPGQAFGRDHAIPDPGSESRALVKAVEAVTSCDIPIATARSASCTADRLPGSLATLLPLVPAEHRQLIGECARGRVRIRRRLSGFDLVGLIEDPADRPTASDRIQAFFDSRAVDVAGGFACSDEPYPISFDWVIVLDQQARTIYSFIINCHD